MANSGFIITDVGMSVASVANVGGPLINPVKFKVGYDVGYSLDPEVLRHRTALNGPILYEGYLEGYTRVDDDTIMLVLPMNYLVGNFSFGEVGIYLQDGTLFALCVFTERIEKIRSNDLNQTGNSYNLRAFLKLAQGAALIQPPEASLDTAKWGELDSVSGLTRPSSSTSNAYLTHSETETGVPIIAVKSNDNLWKFPGYSRYLGEVNIMLGSTRTTIVANVGARFVPIDVPIPKGKYLVQFVSGNLIGVVREVIFSNQSSFEMSDALPQDPAISSRLEIWQSQTSFVDDQFVRRDSGLFIPETARNVLMGIAERADFIPMTKLPDLLKDEDRFSLVPTGTLSYTASNTVPDGFLEANGAAISRSAYPELFVEIGTSYGLGNGTTTFNLPDLRGEFLRGLDNGRGVDPGRLRGTIQRGQLQRHKHVVPLGTNMAPDEASGIAPFGATNTSAKYGLDRDAWGAYWPHTNDGSAFDGQVNTSGIVGNETRPRNVAFMTLIKY